MLFLKSSLVVLSSPDFVVSAQQLARLTSSHPIAHFNYCFRLLKNSFDFRSYSNISSAGDYGRKKLRECDGLVDSVGYLVKKAIEKANIDNKSVENCVCVLRNLSYRAQEVEDPNYDKKQLPAAETRAGAKPGGDNLGCFNASKTKRKESGASSPKETPTTSRGPRSANGKGMDLLWQPEVNNECYQGSLRRLGSLAYRSELEYQVRERKLAQKILTCDVTSSMDCLSSPEIVAESWRHQVKVSCDFFCSNDVQYSIYFKSDSLKTEPRKFFKVLQ